MSAIPKIDTITNDADKNYMNRIILDTDEITALCPLTGLPDFGNLHIEYTPDEKLLELKSFKMWLHNFRNHKIWQEDFANLIMDKLVLIANPFQVSLKLSYKIRGGIETDVTVDYSRPEKAEVIAKPPKSHCWTPKKLLTQMHIGILTTGKQHSTPVNFIFQTYLPKEIFIIADKNSVKVKNIKDNHNVSFLIHQEKGHFKDTSALMIKGIASIYTGDFSDIREFFYKIIPDFKELDEYSSSKHDDEVLIRIKNLKFTYFNGKGILNKGGQ